MKTRFTLAFLFVFGLNLSAQQKMSTKSGKITFEASIPSFEEVSAVNSTATCVLQSATGEISSVAIMKNFRFKMALMEEHFNENYVESDRYPKATFRGKIKLGSGFGNYNGQGLRHSGKTRPSRRVKKHHSSGQDSENRRWHRDYHRLQHQYG